MIQGKQETQLATGYENNSMYPLAEAFVNVAKDLQGRGRDLYMNLPSVMVEGSEYNDVLKSFFINESYDPTDMTPQQIQEYREDMEQLYNNDRAALYEATVGNAINPIIGMALPMHKFILMNMVFDKGGAIPKYVAGSRSFPVTIEYRFLVTPEGERLDMFRDQNLMTDAMNKTMKVMDFEITTFPFNSKDAGTDFITALGGTPGVDELSISTYVSAVKVEQYIDEGDLLPDAEGYIHQGNDVATADTKGTKDVWVHTQFQFTPTYDSFGRAMMSSFVYQTKSLNDTSGKVEIVEIKDTIFGHFEDNVVELATRGNIKGVRVRTKLENALNTQPLCKVDWKEKTKYIEIEDFPALSVPITPQETKDIAGLYNVNQVTKYMSLMKTVMANQKDDTIKARLDESYDRLEPASKTYDQYDFAPREGYASTHVQWRKETFFDTFDLNVQRLLTAYNDPNVTITAFGDPFVISRLIPENISYTSPQSIGPVELDYTRTVFQNTMKIQYQFISSDKLRGTSQLIIILCPRGGDNQRIIYRIYDYQLYMSNEIKDNVHHTLPNLYAFERWAFVEVHPVQGRMDILHISGLTDHYDVIQTRQVSA